MNNNKQNNNNNNSKMAIDGLQTECKLKVMRECLDGLWGYAVSAIKQKDIGCLNYILKTGVTPLVRDLEAIEGDESMNFAKKLLEFIHYVETAIGSIQLKLDMKQTLKQARATSYDQETDEFQRDVDQFIYELDSD